MVSRMLEMVRGLTYSLSFLDPRINNPMRGSPHPVLFWGNVTERAALRHVTTLVTVNDRNTWWILTQSMSRPTAVRCG